MDTSLSTLIFHAFAGNEPWCYVVMLAAEIMAWIQMVAFANTKARRWGPKKLPPMLFESGVKIVSHARQTSLHLAPTAPDVKLLPKGMKQIAALRMP